MALDTRQTNHRVGERWWTCARCGNDYPTSRMVTLKGMFMCSGPLTNHCGEDEYGAQHGRETTEIPTEQQDENPAERAWEDL